MPEEDKEEVIVDTPEEETTSQETEFEELSYNDLSKELLYELCKERNLDVTKEMTKEELKDTYRYQTMKKLLTKATKYK